MKAIILKNSDFKKLKKYKLEKGIFHNESELYYYNSKEILKMFNRTDDENTTNKKVILNSLFSLKENISDERFVMPNATVRLNDISYGYIMNLITNNINLELLLKDNNVPISNKIEILKQVGKIIQYIEHSKEFADIGFHLGDIHDSNFIYDQNDGKVKAIDLDGAYVPSMIAPNSRFLTFNDKLWDDSFHEKYPLDENDRHIPNHNTSVISYVYMLLNNITGEYTPNLSIAAFCDELNLLADAGFKRELLDTFFNIYLPKNNHFDLELIDSITPQKVLKYKENKERSKHN